jgi:3-methyladenine DNA glycosylase/8-oxoguanine DNA glycosylase
LALSTPEGPASLRAHHVGDAIDVEAWGEGAAWALEASPGLLGLLDDRHGFDPQDDVVGRLHRAGDGLRLPRSLLLLDALVPAILSQRVTGFEAKRSYRMLVERWGEPAPGPVGLRLTPPADVIAELPYYDLHVIGVEKSRADALKLACAHASRLQRLVTDDPGQLRTRLEGISGIGPWTSAEVARVVLGDADAVSVGDFHLKHLVCWALAGEERGTDARMLDLLEPYVPQRGRVCVLLETSGISVPRRVPRQRIEPISER